MTTEDEAIDILDQSLETLVSEFGSENGLNDRAYNDACAMLQFLAEQWRGRHLVPRRAVAMILGTVSIMLNVSHDWDESSRGEIETKAGYLDQLIGACFIDPPKPM